MIGYLLVRVEFVRHFVWVFCLFGYQFHRVPCLFGYRSDQRPNQFPRQPCSVIWLGSDQVNSHLPRHQSAITSSSIDQPLGNPAVPSSTSDQPPRAPPGPNSSSSAATRHIPAILGQTRSRSVSSQHLLGNHRLAIILARAVSRRRPPLLKQTSATRFTSSLTNFLCYFFSCFRWIPTH